MDALALLAEFHSWQLSRISPRTYPGDILRRLSTDLPEDKVRGLKAMVLRGECYRCRIAKAEYHFGTTPEEAVKAAIKAHKARKQ